MSIRFNRLFTGAALFIFSLQLSAQGFNVVIDSDSVTTGETVCLPVRAKGFVDLANFQYAITWDTEVIEFTGAQNIDLMGLTPANFYFQPSPGNIVVVSWSDPNGHCLSIPDNQILYELCFTAIGPEGTAATVYVTADGFPPSSGGLEAYNCLSQNVWDNDGGVAGKVAIVTTSGTSDALQNAETSFQLSPNPTQAAAQVAFESDVAGTANLLVTDASGRRVLEQKIAVKTGENKVEIPAKTLTVKGMYQVSLQIGQRVSTQMLSVQ